MSQAQTVMKTQNISLDEIKPSPYQPRLTFDLEDIRGSIKRDGILVPLTVRKKDGYYELIDGERRVRLSRELGYKTVPCTVIDVNDEIARRMVWKVNTLRQEYTPKEKARYFKKLQEEYGMSLRGIARECDYDPHAVKAHLNVFKLPQKYQSLIWDRGSPLTVGHIQELEPLFNGGVVITALVDRLNLIVERKLTVHEFRDVLRPDLEAVRERRIEAAKEVVKEVAPIPEIKLETPEDLEEVAKVLRKEAKRRKTPRQILEEKREKARRTLDNIVATMDTVRELISLEEYQKRIGGLETVLDEDPSKCLSELKTLNRQLQTDIRKAREEEMRRRVEEEAERRARKLEETERRQIEEEAMKKAREEILTSPELLQEVAERAREVSSQELLEMDDRARQAVEEIAGHLKEALLKADMDIKKVKNSEGRRLLENYMIIGAILSSLETGKIFCSKHENEKQALMWKCGTPLSETHEQLKKKLGIG